MADLLDFGGVRVLTSNAAPGAGYVARFYESGTTTPETVYTDSTLGTPHGTFVTADAAGRFSAVWSAGGAIKCVIEDADGAVVQTIDPVISVAATTSGAADVSFTPTVALPFTNVQDAIEGAAASAASGFATYGIGITGNATLIANMDATNIGAGVYRFDNTTTGTFPTGVAAADTGLVEHWRQAAATAMQVLYHATTDRVFHRRMASSAWGTWRENIEVNQGAAEGDTIYRGASAWTRLAKGTALQVLKMNAGATAPEWGADAGQSSNSGDIALSGTGPFAQTGIPSTARKIRIYLEGASLSGTDYVQIQIGDSGGYETTGYSANSDGVNGTSLSGFPIRSVTAATVITGILTLEKHPTTNRWTITADGLQYETSNPIPTNGSKLLSDTLDRIRVLASGANTFDAGNLVFEWES